MRILLSFFLALVFLSVPLLADASIFLSKFGLIGQMPYQGVEDFYVDVETLKIPFRPIQVEGSKDFFGYELLAGDKRGFYASAELNMPGITDPIIYPKQYHRGKWVHWFHLEEGDPLGVYELKIYIDSELFETIKFEVVPNY